MIIDTTAEVAQVVEHGTENAGVDSSSLSLGTTCLFSCNSTSELASSFAAQLGFADILPTFFYIRSIATLVNRP